MKAGGGDGLSLLLWPGIGRYICTYSVAAVYFVLMSDSLALAEFPHTDMSRPLACPRARFGHPGTAEVGRGVFSKRGERHGMNAWLHIIGWALRINYSYAVSVDRQNYNLYLAWHPAWGTTIPGPSKGAEGRDGSESAESRVLVV
ncbi:hypothetical protein LX36DRAFT_280243 [Colletotrichum falcatum]|nr:hypothetical protein LX36DRAFT_280243 [Colletotrichum falcatum]